MKTAGGPRFEVVPNGLVLPQLHCWIAPPDPERPKLDLTFDGGPFDASGTFVELGRQVGRNRNQPGDVTVPTDADHLAGTWVYGGFVRPHFGHVVAESLGRLWAADPHLLGSDVQGLVFCVYVGAPKGDQGAFTAAQRAHATRHMAAQHYLRELVRILCGFEDVRLVGAPVRADRLMIPQQVYGEGDAKTHGYELPFFRAFMQERLSRSFGPSDKRSRIYVSRSRLPRQTGTPVLENILEENLRLEGYDIVHPETLPVREQMAIYHRAGTVVGTSGSALHLANICMNERSRLGLVLRMIGPHRKFLRQARDMGARAEHVEGFIGQILPRNLRDFPGRKWSDPWQVTVLDLESVWRGLHRHGFVTSRALPQPPSAEVVDASIAAAVSRLHAEHEGLDFAYVPVSDRLPN